MRGSRIEVSIRVGGSERENEFGSCTCTGRELVWQRRMQNNINLNTGSNCNAKTKSQMNLNVNLLLVLLWLSTSLATVISTPSGGLRTSV